MTSIFGQTFKNAVAEARGKPAGWGTPGHQNFIGPAPSAGSAGASYHNTGPAPRSGIQPSPLVTQNQTPMPPAGAPIGPKIGQSHTGPVNPGFMPPSGLPQEPAPVPSVGQVPTGFNPSLQQKIGQNPVGFNPSVPPKASPSVQPYPSLFDALGHQRFKHYQGKPWNM